MNDSLKYKWILALSNNLEFGITLNKSGENLLPFKSKEDMKNFRQLTKNATLVMGRSTWESIKTPLRVTQQRVLYSTIPNLENVFKFCKGRRVYVLTQNEELLKNTNATPEVYVTFEECKEKIKGRNDVFVIGGIETFNLFNDPEEIFLSIIKEDFSIPASSIINLKDYTLKHFPRKELLCRSFHLLQDTNPEYESYYWKKP